MRDLIGQKAFTFCHTATNTLTDLPSGNVALVARILKPPSPSNAHTEHVFYETHIHPQVPSCRRFDRVGLKFYPSLGTNLSAHSPSLLFPTPTLNRANGAPNVYFRLCLHVNSTFAIRLMTCMGPACLSATLGACCIPRFVLTFSHPSHARERPFGLPGLLSELCMCTQFAWTLDAAHRVMRATRPRAGPPMRDAGLSHRSVWRSAPFDSVGRWA
jgi:hypothetical protein